jgi:magnesium transporter
MIKTHTFGGETWTDIDHGTPEEMHSIMDTYGIHPFVAKELTAATPRSRVEAHGNYLYCIMHFPVWKHTHTEGKSQEIDFIITKNAVITARYDTIDAIHQLSKDVEVEEILNKNTSIKAAEGHVLFISILRGLYSSVSEELEYIDDLTESITSKMFKGKEREIVVSVSEVTRILLDFKRVTDLHREILTSLRREGEKLFGENFAENIDSIISDYFKISTAVQSNLEILRELRNTNNSLLAAKQNETIKRFTIIGSILFILNLIVALSV